MTGQSVSADFDELRGRARKLEDYAQGVTADTRASEAMLAGHRHGYSGSSYEDVGETLALAREARQKVGQKLAADARSQAAAHANTISTFSDIDTDVKASMEQIAKD
jgi:hypothetical protein